MNKKQPISKDDLLTDLKRIGIKKDMNLMIHSSLSAIGWVIGGSQTVISALMEIIGEEGTIVMPSATPNCLHPSQWEKKLIPEEWFPKVIEHMQVFNKDITPTTMGIIPETLRTWPKTVRSNHPISSVCAWGKLAKTITKNHQLEISEGKNTPYEKIYHLDFNILLIGVGFNRCTMLHYAESLSKNRRLTESNYPIIENDEKVWVKVSDMANDNDSHFPIIGTLFLDKNKVSAGNIGDADSMLFFAKDIVDFGKNYFENIDNKSHYQDT